MVEAKTVLVVEDERIVAEDISEILRSMGCFVCGIAATGLHAMELFVEFSPDLILMDVVLQGDMDGIETACRINKIRDASVVFLTAYSDRGVLDRAKEAGPIGYIVKPFDENNLRSTVEIALHRAQIEKAVSRNPDWLVTGLRSISNGVVAVDRFGRIEFMNKAAEDMTGISSMAAYGIELRKLDVFLMPDHTSVVDLPVKNVLAKGVVVESVEYVCRNKSSDKHFPVEVTVSPVRNSSENIVGGLLVFSDTSLPEKTEQVHEEQRARLESRVQERTADLKRVYEDLLKEVSDRKALQSKLESLIALERLGEEISSRFLRQQGDQQVDALIVNLHELRKHLDFDFAVIVELSPKDVTSISHSSIKLELSDSDINDFNGCSLSENLLDKIERECCEWEPEKDAGKDSGDFIRRLEESNVCTAMFIPVCREGARRFMMLGTFNGRCVDTGELRTALAIIGHMFCSAFDRLRIDGE